MLPRLKIYFSGWNSKWHILSCFGISVQYYLQNGTAKSKAENFHALLKNGLMGDKFSPLGLHILTVDRTEKREPQRQKLTLSPISIPPFNNVQVCGNASRWLYCITVTHFETKNVQQNMYYGKFQTFSMPIIILNIQNFEKSIKFFQKEMFVYLAPFLYFTNGLNVSEILVNRPTGNWAKYLVYYFW